MRTLHLSLAGTVMVALLGGASVAMAQGEDPGIQAVAEISGTVMDSPKLPGADSSDMGAYVDRRGDCQWSMEWDDARLPKTLWLHWVSHEYHVPGTANLLRVHVGTIDRATEDGSWSGTFRHTMATDGLRVFDATLEGADDYEGLTAIIDGSWTGFSGWGVRGAIVPDMPHLAEVPTD